jgi:phosphoglycolate phosphatase-like HAD superfamily hydrolase
MLLDAIEDLDIEPGASWFVGDSITDAQAGRAAGVHTVLIGQHPENAADIVVADIGSVPASLIGNLHRRDDV